MIRNILFLLPMIASCNRFAIGYMDAQGSSKDPSIDYESYVLNEDTYPDQYFFSQKNLQCVQLWYTNFMRSNPAIVILDLYNCIDQYSRLPLVGPIGKLAADKVQPFWRQGKQIFGKEQEIFGQKDLALVRTSLREIPEGYKQPCLNMILGLVDWLFQMRPEQYEGLSKRLTDFEKSLGESAKKDNPTYDEEMAYLKKLLMEHFNAICGDTFYSDCYASCTSYFQNYHILLPLAVCSGSQAVVNDFLAFLKQKGRKIDLGDYSIILCSQTN